MQILSLSVITSDVAFRSKSCDSVIVVFALLDLISRSVGVLRGVSRGNGTCVLPVSHYRGRNCESWACVGVRGGNASLRLAPIPATPLEPDKRAVPGSISAFVTAVHDNFVLTLIL
jgi:hypothetical protein